MGVLIRSHIQPIYAVWPGITPQVAILNLGSDSFYVIFHHFFFFIDIPEEEPQVTGEVETATVDFETDRVETERSPVSPRRVSFQVIPIKQKQAKYVRRYDQYIWGDF